MSQNSIVINDATGATVLAAINAALDTLASQASGAGSPNSTIAYQVWADTANGVIKQRNAANTGWIARAPLAETLVIARASNTALTSGDFCRCIIASGTWTQTFSAASTLGDGWFVEYRNNGTGTITLDPNGSEQIDGATTTQLAPGETCCIYCNGTAFYTVGRTAPSQQSQTATAFTTGGTAPAFTLTPVPAINPLAANQRFRASFNAAGTTGSNTLNVNGTGAKSLMQFDANGTLVPAIIPSGLLADVEYNGTYWVVLDPIMVQPNQIQPITATVASNALTATLNPTSLTFRSATLSNGAVSTLTNSAALSLTVPSGATLGSTNGVAATYALLAINNGGTEQLGIVNMAGGVSLDEGGLISATAISSSATSASTIYSTSAVTNMPFRVAGYIAATEATAGTWATAPTLVQGASVSLLGFGSSLSGSGYQKLPTGLIIQWGTFASTTSGYSNSFPIAFPNACYSIASSTTQGTPVSQYTDLVITSASTFTATSNGGTPGGCFIAIGR